MLKMQYARIASASLLLHDNHLRCKITFDFGDVCQILFVHARIAEAMHCLLKTVGVSSWNTLPGAFCRVRSRDLAVEEIGHIENDSWFIPGNLNSSGEAAREQETVHGEER